MELVIIILVACLATLLFAPLNIYLAKRFSLVDDPKKRPHPAHIHLKVLPRAGGLSVYPALILTSLFFLPVDKHLIGIFLAVTILLIVGLLDDRLRSFSPYLRLGLMFLAAGVAVSSGIGISFITNPLLSQPLRLDQWVVPFTFLGPHRIIPLADLFAFLWIVSLTQVINWSKGVDGQMPGIITVAAIVLGLLSLKLYWHGDINQLQVAKLSFIVSGCALGFLILNWSPAKIIPGFSTSTILAFMIAVLAILSGAKVATALLVLAVPAADFVYTLIRRLAAGKSPVWGDRGHLHHRLLDIGWKVWQISLFYILGSVILGVIALSVSTASKAFVVLIVAIVFAVFVLWINSFGALSKKADRGNG